MDTASLGSVSAPSPQCTTLHASLSPCLALLLSGLLLAIWLTAVSAKEKGPVEPSIDLQTDSLALPGSLTASQQPSTTLPILAPTASNYDLAIAKSKIPQTFTVGANNRYIITVYRTNTETITSTMIVEDILPPGMTWTPPTTAGIWDCTLSTPR